MGMKVWVVVEHYDRGSDEVDVPAVFGTKEAAENFIKTKYYGWEWLGEEDDVLREGYYSEPEDEMGSDYVFIVEKEVM